jgi:hypothetical protein
MKWNEIAEGEPCKLLKTWWPGTESNRRRQPFQGCLPTRLSGSGSKQVHGIQGLPRPTSWDCLGSLRLFSPPRCSRIVPAIFSDSICSQPRSPFPMELLARCTPDDLTYDSRYEVQTRAIRQSQNPIQAGQSVPLDARAVRKSFRPCSQPLAVRGGLLHRAHRARGTAGSGLPALAMCPCPRTLGDPSAPATARARHSTNQINSRGDE